MSDRDALLQAIRENPFEILPRMMYADHLDDFPTLGDAHRAAFIRAQCALANDPTEANRSALARFCDAQLGPVNILDELRPPYWPPLIRVEEKDIPPEVPPEVPVHRSATLPPAWPKRLSQVIRPGEPIRVIVPPVYVYRLAAIGVAFADFAAELRISPAAIGVAFADFAAELRISPPDNRPYLEVIVDTRSSYEWNSATATPMVFMGGIDISVKVAPVRIHTTLYKINPDAP